NCVIVSAHWESPIKMRWSTHKKSIALLVPTTFSIILIAAVLNAPSCLWAQSATTGALRGTVVDPTGAVVPGVTVTLVNATTGQMQTTMTDAKGLYGFSLLSPGTYDVDFSAQGFKTSRAMSVIINVSEAPDLEAQLEPGEAEERVACQCVFSETATTSIGTLVAANTITPNA